MEKKVIECVETLIDLFHKDNEVIEKSLKLFLTKTLTNDTYKNCGDFSDVSLRIKAEDSFNCDINIVTADKLVYDNERGLAVWDDNGEPYEWDSLYIDDKVLLATHVLLNYKDLIK